VKLVKQHDFENYLAGLLVPSEHRASFFAVRAFNVELALMRDQAHGNALAGKIRFQWWRDVLEELYSGNGDGIPALAKQQPVAHALADVAKKRNLSLHWFLRSLDARQRDFGGEQPETMEDLENYAEQGHASILYLLLESLDVRHEKAEFAASHVGVCSGITTLLRGFPYHAAQKQLYLPRAIMMKHSLKVATVFAGPSSDEESKALENCIYDVASQAFGHLDRARSLQKEGLPPTAIYALFPAVRSSLFLETLRTANFNPSTSHLYDQNHLAYQLQLVWSKMTKRF